MKVIRYMNTLLFNGLNESYDMLIYALTKNSLLTKEEYQRIEEVIKPLLEKEKVKG